MTSFPEPTDPAGSRTQVFRVTLDYFRGVRGGQGVGAGRAGAAAYRLPSGWTPLELLKHLTYVELRWLEWGFEGRDVAEPWGDRRDDRWYVGPTRRADLASAAARLAHRRPVVASHDLRGRRPPRPAVGGADPATLERVLFHLVQEYARHLGHLDVVAELAGGPDRKVRPLAR